MYPEIKEYITHLVLRDIVCPKEIRQCVSQYACDNFLVKEAHDSKCYLSTIYEIRTLVKGFIYYVQSDIDSYAKNHESKKLMICLGNAYPTLYFVQHHPNKDEHSDIQVVEVDGDSVDGSLPLNETINLIKKSNEEFIVEVQSQKEKAKKPFKIFVTTGLSNL